MKPTLNKIAELHIDLHAEGYGSNTKYSVELERKNLVSETNCRVYNNALTYLEQVDFSLKSKSAADKLINSIANGIDLKNPQRHVGAILGALLAYGLRLQDDRSTPYLRNPLAHLSVLPAKGDTA